MKTKNNIYIKYGIVHWRILTRKDFLKNEKVANQKHGSFENIIPSFLISELSILPYSQNRKLGFKNLGKKFPRLSRLPRFPSFRPGLVGAHFLAHTHHESGKHNPQDVYTSWVHDILEQTQHYGTLNFHFLWRFTIFGYEMTRNWFGSTILSINFSGW